LYNTKSQDKLKTANQAVFLGWGSGTMLELILNKKGLINIESPLVAIF
jgi:hypothetical protein